MAVALAVAVWLPCACDRKSSASLQSTDPLMVTSGEGRVVADERGFTPASLALAKGIPGSKATVTFVRTSDKTCATEVVFPDLGIRKDLPLDQPVAVDVPTDSPRTRTFQCGMAMYKGMLVVK
jgi:plastocyanin domain-containing protein